MAAKKNKSPAFQFYPKDFLTDDKVLEMSAEVRGLYISLLCVDWLNDGFFPGNILKLAGFEWLSHDGAIRADSSAIETQLLSCFEPHPTKEGYVTNRRLQKERVEQAWRRNERSESGKKGARKKWRSHDTGDGSAIPVDGSAIEEPIAKNGSSSSSSSSSSIDLSPKGGAPPSVDHHFGLIKLTDEEFNSLVMNHCNGDAPYCRQQCALASDYRQAKGAGPPDDSGAYMRTWLFKAREVFHHRPRKGGRRYSMTTEDMLEMGRRLDAEMQEAKAT